jgi:hypothetical protein
MSGMVVSNATDEKQSKYGSIYLNKYISRVTNPFPVWFFMISDQPMENKNTPTIEFANHPKIGFFFQ